MIHMKPVDSRKFPMNKRFTAKQALALPLLASGSSGVETAHAIGVKASTVSFWLNHCPEFVEALHELRETAMRQSIEQLQGTLSMAVDEVRKILSTSNNEALRLKAAQFIIERYASPKSNLEAVDPVDRGDLALINSILKGPGASHATN